MSNIFSSNTASQSGFLQISNGGTDVFIVLLALAGSSIATRKSEIRLITAIASQDQSILGRGCVGFDLSELPWSKSSDEFLKDKAFLIRTIERVISRQDWHRLDYEPNVERALANQQTFLAMVEGFEFANSAPSNQIFPLLPETIEGRCEKHAVYLHRQGCVVCNEA